MKNWPPPHKKKCNLVGKMREVYLRLTAQTLVGTIPDDARCLSDGFAIPTTPLSTDLRSSLANCTSPLTA